MKFDIFIETAFLCQLLGADLVVRQNDEVTTLLLFTIYKKVRSLPYLWYRTFRSALLIFRDLTSFGVYFFQCAYKISRKILALHQAGIFLKDFYRLLKLLCFIKVLITEIILSFLSWLIIASLWLIAYTTV